MSVLLETGHIEEGLRWFDRAFELNPASLTVKQRAYSALLAHGYMAEGWAAHESRPAVIEIARRHSGVALERELPVALEGKRICLLREQGLGDEFFFLRFAARLKSAGARVTYQATNKIRSLLTRVDCLDEVLPETATLPQADVTMLVGDLPRALSVLESSAFSSRTVANNTLSTDDIPHRIAVFWPPLPGTLTVPPLESAMAAMRKRLSDLGRPPYIGISWKGGTPPESQPDSSTWLLYKQIGIQDLAAALKDLPGTFIALQRKPPAGEIEAFSRLLGRDLHDFSELNNDLENMLAVLAQIDEYIGVSNTNMHLRAAVGRTARVIVPQPAEWRWMASGAASPWFPGFPIYRQSVEGSWSSALARLKADLAASNR
jgi:hypothetical protein